jgi:hypothetical protein
MPNDNRLIVSADLHGFFRDEVVASKRQVGAQVAEATEYYLVQLLVDFSRVDVTDLYQNEPLLVLHQRAQEAPLAQQMVIFKQMGDWALYVAGFFAEFIERSLVTTEYYSAMGTAAYRNLAGLCASSHKPHTLHAMYLGLAQQFSTLVDVLTQVCHRARERNSTDVDLLKLYDRYVHTQNDRVRKMLEGRGLNVAEVSGTKKVTSH